jgi:hypothetical protein
MRGLRAFDCTTRYDKGPPRAPLCGGKSPLRPHHVAPHPSPPPAPPTSPALRPSPPPSPSLRVRFTVSALPWPPALLPVALRSSQSPAPALSCPSTFAPRPAVGSGGNFALAAARALMDVPGMDALTIGTRLGAAWGPGWWNDDDEGRLRPGLGPGRQWPAARWVRLDGWPRVVWAPGWPLGGVVVGARHTGWVGLRHGRETQDGARCGAASLAHSGLLGLCQSSSLHSAHSSSDASSFRRTNFPLSLPRPTVLLFPFRFPPSCPQARSP